MAGDLTTRTRADGARVARLLGIVASRIVKEKIEVQPLFGSLQVQVYARPFPFGWR